MEVLLDTIFNIVSFIGIISVIVFIHEFGHYYVARRAGVRIEVFSIGFGKEIFSWLDSNNTKWKIGILPLGGYVKMFGDKNEASVPDFKKMKELSPEDTKISFHTKNLKWKMAIVSAGPIANYLLAIVIMTFLFSFYGMSKADSIISNVELGSVADKIGLKSGDKIIAINDKSIDQFSDIQRALALNNGESMSIKIARGEDQYSFDFTPDLVEREDIFGNKIKTHKLGIMSGEFKTEKLAIHRAVLASIEESYSMSVTTFSSLVQMILHKRGTEELGGPIKIAKYSGQSVKKGIHVVLWLIAVLSINLGFINLLPIPMLDGGHLFYYVVEAIKGSPVSEKIQQIGFQIGLILLIMLFVFTTFNDIKNTGLF